jgi:hypothetical protein
MKTTSRRAFAIAVGRTMRTREVRALCRYGALSFLVACGSDLAPATPQVLPPPPPPEQGVSLGMKTDYLVEIGESVTAVARVTGTDTPVSWALHCDTGQASIVPSGNSATVTALAGGVCFLKASEGPTSIVAIVRIPPLTPGDSCTVDSQCGPGAPVCGAGGGCAGSCTTLCMTDADCPLSGASGDHVACLNHVCHLVRDQVYSCD